MITTSSSNDDSDNSDIFLQTLKRAIIHKMSKIHIMDMKQSNKTSLNQRIFMLAVLYCAGNNRLNLQHPPGNSQIDESHI